ncbi:MAG: hypothetical protein AAGH89_17795 [Verrucomicrobiota bacterium]
MNPDDDETAKSDRMHWPHAPLHQLQESGTYFVTAGTYLKEHFFGSRKRLRMVQERFLKDAAHFGWQLEAWAIFSNHYHFVAHSPEDQDDAASLPKFLSTFHGQTAQVLNQWDSTPGRRVWYNYRESLLTYEKSYFARLNYTHNNPVHHDLVAVANQYPWCSAAWFERKASPAQVDTIYGFKIDQLNVYDDFEVFRG